MNVLTDVTNDDIYAALRIEYQDARRAGMSHEKAKSIANAEVKRCWPELNQVYFNAINFRRQGGDGKEAASFISALSPLYKKWRNELDAVSSSPVLDVPVIPPPPNGNGSAKTFSRERHKLVLYESGNTNVTATVFEAVKRFAPQNKQVINFGNLYLWADVIGCSTSAISNVIFNRANSHIMKDAGFIFELMPDASESDFRIRVLAVPQNEHAKKIAELEAKQAELAAMIAAMKQAS